MPKQTFFNLPDEKRQLVLSLATDEFAANDYETASISKIVTQAGIAKGSFYQYFEDKLDLYRYLLEEGTRQKVAFLQQHPPPDPAMGTFAYLRWLLKIGLSYEVVNPKLAKIAQRALNGKGPYSAQFLEQVQEQSMRFFRQLMAEGVARGDLRADLDVETAAFVFHAVSLELGRYIMRRLDIDPESDNLLGAMAQHEAEVEAIYDSLLTVLEQGMGK